jgi:hypothetical protein
VRPALTVLGTVQGAERTALGHVHCHLDAGSIRYPVLADPQPLMTDGRRIHAVLVSLRKSSPDSTARWHLIWCRPERLPSDDGPDLGASECTPPKD